ncbi:unnamed protein product [Aspergillus oryzae]|nr:unnamed protein product [Aspergillus oryzae]GMF97375.1 unnamed protein product [Aspergillus oryzae]
MVDVSELPRLKGYVASFGTTLAAAAAARRTEVGSESAAAKSEAGGPWLGLLKADISAVLPRQELASPIFFSVPACDSERGGYQLISSTMSEESSQTRVRLPTKILSELGLLSLWKSSLDVKLLCAQRFVRLFAYGGSTLILASYLSSLGISDARIGLFMTLTLVGDVVISFFLTLFADTMGRKAVLLLGSVLMVVNRGWQFIAACQMIFFAYAAIGALKFILAAILSPHVEAEKQKPVERQGQQGGNGETQPLLGGGEQPPKKPGFFSFLGDRDLVALVVRLSILFALDSFASGLASMYTMVFTHLPSAICLALIPVPNILPLALTFLVLRACSQNMDVAPRSAFLAAALPSDKRTAIMGAINVVKTSSQSLGPLITGVLSNHGLFGLSFTIAGILKAIYDIGMLLSFAGTEPVRRQRSGQDDASA